jgi:rhodanese-related sulfurtransferase
MIKSINKEETERLIQEKEKDKNFVILDIRTPSEFQSENIEGAINIDFYAFDFREKMAELKKDKTYLIYCRTGSRTKVAMEIMRQLQFTDVYEVDKGIVSLM